MQLFLNLISEIYANKEKNVKIKPRTTTYIPQKNNQPKIDAIYQKITKLTVSNLVLLPKKIKLIVYFILSKSTIYKQYNQYINYDLNVR